MDELTNLMRLIDLNSEIIPEGNYLEMCNSIKKVHDTMSRSNSNDDSESDDDEQFRIREIIRRDMQTPFSAQRSNRRRYYDTDTDDDSEDLQNADADVGIEDPPGEDDDVLMASPGEARDLLRYVNSVLPHINVPREIAYDVGFHRELRQIEMAHNENELRRLEQKIVDVQRTIRKTKIRQRITANVRKDAVKKRAQELNMRLPRYTIGALLDKGHNVGNEREFYKTYLDEYNDEVVNKLSELNDDLVGFLREKDCILAEMNELDG
tara:strand:- start:4505 stop:5302 length:798 start_codon:yes stop_codon:yes gene_type:complete